MHGDLIDAEILTSPLPHVFAQPGQDWGTDTLPVGVQTPPKSVWKCSYGSQKPPKKLGAWGPNRCWDIDFPTPLCICSTWPSYQIPMLHLWVCQHLPSGLKIFQCVSEFSKQFGVLNPYRCWDIDSSTPPCICSSWPRYGHWCSACECANTPHKWSKMFLCVSATYKKNLVHGDLIDA